MQDTNTEHLVQLVTIPPEPLKVVNALGQGQDTAVVRRVVEQDAGCYLPAYFERHAADILRDREAALDPDAALRSYVGTAPQQGRTLCVHSVLCAWLPA